VSHLLAAHTGGGRLTRFLRRFRLTSVFKGREEVTATEASRVRMHLSAPTRCTVPHHTKLRATIDDTIDEMPVPFAQT
jgi:hypothetical protein